MKYKITICAHNALGEQLPDVVLSVNNDGHVKFASYFESHYFTYEFDTPEQAVKALNEYLKETEEIKLCEIDCDKYILIRESHPMFHKTGYEIREVL